jgi:hypothetical protein
VTLYSLAMEIKRAGPPTTHDMVLWRVPLSAPPSAEWQRSFQTAEVSSMIAIPKSVHFEPAALTFRSAEQNIPEWIQFIDKWISCANQAQGAALDERSRAVARGQQQTDDRRQRATDANEKFKDL